MNIGEKIKSLRLQYQFTQEDLANRAELSKGFISQLENNLTSPSITTLMDVLQVLGTDLKSFFSDFEDSQIVFNDDDYFVNVDHERRHQYTWLVPNAQKHTMEPVKLLIESKGHTVKDLPHEGEEFGYVIRGVVTLHVGKKSFTVSAGESFFYTCDKLHYIENKSTRDAELLWVSSPPNF